MARLGLAIRQRPVRAARLGSPEPDRQAPPPTRCGRAYEADGRVGFDPLTLGDPEGMTDEEDFLAASPDIEAALLLIERLEEQPASPKRATLIEALHDAIGEALARQIRGGMAR